VDDREHAHQRRRTTNAVIGTGIGSIVQASSVVGGIHFHGRTDDAVPIPRQLVKPPPVFAGRQSELSLLSRVHEDPNAAMAMLTGPGGVGKTALARRWAHDHRDAFPAGQLYIDLNGFSESDPVDPGEALASFLRALGVPPAAVPAGLPELAALYRSQTASRALLVVLDNAVSAAQVRVLLPASDESFAVVTSRLRMAALAPDGAVIIDVRPLSVGDSVSLLSQVAGRARIDDDPVQAANLAGLCAGLPIALSVAAARLAARPMLTLARLVADLEAEATRLHHLRMPDEASVQGTLDLSYRNLAPQVAVLYRRLSAHPGREFGVGVVGALLPSISGIGPDLETAAIDQLVQASLVEESSLDRFQFHDLLRLHARQRLTSEDTKADQDDAARSLLEWYLAAAQHADLAIRPYRRSRLSYRPRSADAPIPSFTDRTTALAWLEREHLNLIAAGRMALTRGWAELAWHLSNAIWPLLLYGKHYRDRIGIDELGVAAARTWGNRTAEALMLCRLGRACTTAGRYDDAEHHLRLAVTLWNEVGDPQGAAEAQELTAALYRETGRITEAVSMYESVLAINRDLGDARWIGLTSINLGSLLPEASRTAEAVAVLLDARRIFTDLADLDPYNGFRAEIALAAAYLALCDISKARTAAARGAEGMRELGSAFEQGQALEVLGQVAHVSGDLPAARRHWAGALRIYDSLQSSRATTLRDRIRRTPGANDPVEVQDSGEAAK
jgi:tetratricopeptide (TPR) repeat protein